MTSTPILHVDMDAFYASVATRDRPDLRDRPVIVGGGERGVVLAANYAARAYGVHSAMPGAQARRLCPQAVVLAPDYPTFTRVSVAVMECFHRVTPMVEAVSLDEAFLDVSGALRLLGSPQQIAERVRATVHDEQGITCSVGIAATISVAKLASRKAKPDGVLSVAPTRVVEFLHPLDVGELYGVGPSTRDRLHGLGYRLVGDLAHTPLPRLTTDLGAHLAQHLHHLAWGTDRSQVQPGRVGVFGHGGGDGRPGSARPDHSMGAQETFARDTAEREVVARELLRLSTKVTGRMRRARVLGRTVAITVRFSDFTTLSRSRTLPEPTDVNQEVYRCALELYDAVDDARTRVRLVGVRVEGLIDQGRVHRQGVLGERESGWSEADRAVDLASSRFGPSAVGPASLLGGAGVRPRTPRGEGDWPRFSGSVLP